MSSHNMTIEEMDRNELENELRDAYDEKESLQERIKELESTQPKWISFEDKVPTMYQNILVNVPGANKENRMEPTRSIFWCPAREYDLKLGILYYTHWMPLPPPPTEENTATEKEDK